MSQIRDEQLEKALQEDHQYIEWCFEELEKHHPYEDFVDRFYRV